MSKEQFSIVITAAFWEAFCVLEIISSYPYNIFSLYIYMVREIRWIFDEAISIATVYMHDVVIKWKHFPCYWPFVRGMHRSSVNSPHKGQWRGALMFSLICVWINAWVNNREAGHLRCYHAHYDVSVMETRACYLIGMYVYCTYNGYFRYVVASTFLIYTNLRKFDVI